MSENSNKFEADTSGYLQPKYLIDLHLVEDQLVVSMEKVPCWFHRFMTKLLLGWTWKFRDNK